MKLRKNMLASLAVLALGATPALAVTTVFEETFDYPDGNLDGQGTWTAYSSAGTRPVQVSSGAAIVDHGGTGEDIVGTFALQTSGVISATFDFSVSSDYDIGTYLSAFTGNLTSVTTASQFDYFAGFKYGTESSTNSYFSTLALVYPSDGTEGDFRIRISSDRFYSDATIATANLLFDTVYQVTLTYDFDTGYATATIGSETITSGDATSLTQNAENAGIDGVFFRQDDNSWDETITVDNLVVTTSVPEPSATLLGALGSLALLRRRRS